MKRKLKVGIFPLIFFIIGCAGVLVTPMRGEAKVEQALPSPPAITQVFASPELRPGETWRVYLKASDPVGEMEYIVCTIDQPGVGEYPISRTRIHSDKSKEINGYVYLGTSGFERLDGVNFTLTVQIEDATGQYSKPAKLSLSLNNLYQQEPPPAGMFKDDDLGPILIQVRGFREGEMGPSFFFRHHR